VAEGYRIERVRLYPTVAQRWQLESYAGAHRWTWMRTDRRREVLGDEKRLLTRLKTPVGAGGARLTSVSKKQ